jgi:hypothetical protein
MDLPSSTIHRLSTSENYRWTSRSGDRWDWIITAQLQLCTPLGATPSAPYPPSQTVNNASLFCYTWLAQTFPHLTPLWARVLDVNCLNEQYRSNVQHSHHVSRDNCTARLFASNAAPYYPHANSGIRRRVNSSGTDRQTSPTHTVHWTAPVRVALVET